MNIRKKRAVITPEILAILKDQLIKGRDIKDISLSLNLSIDCVRKLANKLSSGLPENNIIKKKGRKPKENLELKTLVNCPVDEDNALTQLKMQKTLESSGIFRSQSFLSKTLKKIDITRKRLSLVPIERNSDRVLDLRRVYAVEMQNTPIENMVFLDETGFNLHTAQHYGYSTKGTKAVTFVKANKSINQTLMCCIDLNGVIGYEINQGAYNGDLFKSFIENHLAEYFRRNKNAILIMDNCRFHHRSDVLR